MNKLTLSIVTENYDRIQALKTGEVEIPGCEINYANMKPSLTFNRAFGVYEFDVTELSLSSYMLNVSRGAAFHYRALPIFLSRVFPHGSIYIRTDRGITTPQDLKGRLIGSPNYNFTRGLVVRGMLQDEYDVKPTDIRWRIGPVDHAGDVNYTAASITPGLHVEQIEEGSCLGAELAEGRIDGIIHYRAPQIFTDQVPNIGRLFPEFQPIEEDWYRRTGVFPTMHVVGIRRSLVDQHPELALDVCKAFQAAKTVALQHLGDLDALIVTLPWLVAETEATIRLMGEDYWPYGVAKNRKMIDAQARWSFEQGLSTRQLTAEELFVPSTLDWSP